MWGSWAFSTKMPPHARWRAGLKVSGVGAVGAPVHEVAPADPALVVEVATDFLSGWLSLGGSLGNNLQGGLSSGLTGGGSGGVR